VWSLSLITPPAAEPLDMETEVYPHLRLEPELVPQETLLRLQVQAARQRCEEYTSRQCITATWELWLDGWDEPMCSSGGGRIYIPRAPLQMQAGPVNAPTAGVLSVSYTDTTGSTITLATDQYGVSAPQGPTAAKGSIYPSVSAVWWPLGVPCRPGAIRIRFTAGYGPDFRSVPAGLRQGMLLTVGELDSSREDQTVGTTVTPNLLRAEQLWYPFRLW
jgi:uncharacterized phiE125 gp8 family phage protein